VRSDCHRIEHVVPVELLVCIRLNLRHDALCVCEKREVPPAAYFSIRQHTSAHVSIRQHAAAKKRGATRRLRGAGDLGGFAQSAAALVTLSPEMSAYVSIRQHTSAYVSIRQHTAAYVSIHQQSAAGMVTLSPEMSAHVSIRQHTSAYVSIR
jgi:hypothetical protein